MLSVSISAIVDDWCNVLEERGKQVDNQEERNREFANLVKQYKALLQQREQVTQEVGEELDERLFELRQKAWEAFRADILSYV